MTIQERIVELLEKETDDKAQSEQNRCAMACQGCGAVFILK